MSNLLHFPTPAAVEPPSAPTGLNDTAQRAHALDTRSSFIVEAPAGSGKTGLIVQRFLKLLLDPDLDAPEEALAITFTNKATAELRERVLQQLQNAASHKPLPDNAPSFELETRTLATAVLDQDTARGWNLLATPHRLNIRSIDSVCAAIANSVPVLSGSGGQRNILPDARPLYLAAARRTLGHLGGTNPALHTALRTVLLHRDGQLADTEHLLASMLAAREQWGELVPLGPEELTDDFLDGTVRTRLESVLESIVCAGLSRAASLMPASLLAELTDLAARWSTEPGHNGGPNPLQPCREWSGAPGTHADHLEHWRLLISLLIKKDGDWRKRHNAADVGIKLPKAVQERLKEIIEEISADRLKEALEAVRDLPPARYPDDQWRVAKALFHVLRHMLAELRVLFAERSECDFTELSLAAREALHHEPTLGDIALAGSGRLRHLLVDEMQDTSAAQYDLLEQLTRSWDGHTQTLFLVGDPKQSIYLFRQARVERFLRTMKDGALGDLPLTPLRLTANFRSQAALVARFNDTFDRLFPHPDDDVLRAPAAADVPFVEAAAVREPTIAAPLRWHLTIRDRQAGDTAANYVREEAESVRSIIQRWHTEPLPADRKKPWRIAVLARGRNHLVPIAAELRRAGIPFRAIEVESLAERQEVLDCLALTRALLHPADRVAWLAVLRAPWCGLTLADLLSLTGDIGQGDRRATVSELVRDRAHLLSTEAHVLLSRAWPVLQAAVATLGRDPLSTHVERTWLTLGGDLALPADARTNTRRFFALLREIEALNDGLVELPLLTAKLADLYAEPAGTDDDVQLMTIHKAKGLEWDVVLIPGLERKSGDDRSELLNWLELDTTGDNAGHILLAPIQGKGEASDALNKWLRRTRTARERAETKRVFYVACTRAREELHLFAALDLTTRGALGNPQPGSLLYAAKDAAMPLAEQFHAQSVPSPELPGPADEQPYSLALAAHAEEPLLDALTGAGLTGELTGELTAPPPTLHRLPPHVDPAARFRHAASQRLSYPPAASLSDAAAFTRPEGSFAARAFGNVVHRFLELLSDALKGGATPESLRTELPSWSPRVLTSLRGEGLAPSLAEREAARVLAALTNTLDDPQGRWLITPHPGSATEASLSTPAGTLRADLTFLAGDRPHSNDISHLWIVDFKTTDRGARDADMFEADERAKYEPQMQRYRDVRRTADPRTPPVILALYYPLDRRLISWNSSPDLTLVEPFDPPLR